MPVRKSQFFILLVAAATTVAKLSAAPVLTGQIEFVPAPPSLLVGEFESSTYIRLLFERGVTTTADTTVNIVTPGVFTSNPGTATLGPGTYASWILHFDALGEPAGLGLAGTVRFQLPVLALISNFAQLNATHTAFGAPGTTYPTTQHQVDFGTPFDTVTLSSDRYGVEVNWSTGSFVDEMRILTATPEPGTCSVVVVGLMLVACGRCLSPGMSHSRKR